MNSITVFDKVVEEIRTEMIKEGTQATKAQNLDELKAYISLMEKIIDDLPRPEQVKGLLDDNERAVLKGVRKNTAELAASLSKKYYSQL